MSRHLSPRKSQLLRALCPEPLRVALLLDHLLTLWLDRLVDLQLTRTLSVQLALVVRTLCSFLTDGSSFSSL